MVYQFSMGFEISNFPKVYIFFIINWKNIKFKVNKKLLSDIGSTA